MSGILALDQSRRTGWAWCEPGCEPRWGTKTVGHKDADTDDVAIAFDDFLQAAITAFSPAVIIYETPYVGGGRAKLNPQTILMLGWMAGHIALVARRREITCWKQGTIAAVRDLTGRGKFDDRKAKKLATMQACWARGWKATEDAADAIALLLFAEKRLYPEAYRQRRMVLKTPTGPLFETHTTA